MDEGIAAVTAKAEGDFWLEDLAQLVRSCRSYRRFDESDPIPRDLMIALVNLARVTSSGANRQPLRYRVVSAKAERSLVFPHLAWAGALKNWDGPAAGERPTGYVVICDAGEGATTSVDEGIAAQTILLAATQAGYGGCMLHAFDHDAVAAALSLPEGVSPLMVVALGKPDETVVLEEAPAGVGTAELAYWRDAEDVHHVPKRPLGDVLL